MLHFIEEQRAAVVFDLADAPFAGAGEGVGLVAEISLSNRFSGRPPQFSATNGWVAAAEIVQAARDQFLPVPVSPSISTLAEVSATLAISSRRFCMAGERPMMRPSRALFGQLPARARLRATGRVVPARGGPRRPGARGEGFSMKS
jgi:hypothetical protein